MNKQSIEILNAVIKYNPLHNNYDKNLVIMHSRGTFLVCKLHGPFLSFEDLTSEDFFEIYRYKKSLEESKDNKGK